jgi:hypothetical protein
VGVGAKLLRLAGTLVVREIRLCLSASEANVHMLPAVPVLSYSKSWSCRQQNQFYVMRHVCMHQFAILDLELLNLVSLVKNCEICCQFFYQTGGFF